MKRSELKAGAKSIERGSTFAKPRSEMAKGEGLKRTRMKPGKRNSRSKVEQAQAEAWHRLVCAGRICVRRGCNAPAGPWGHHAPRKEWLNRQGVGHVKWDPRCGVPPCPDCHDRHETGVVRITRDDLIASGDWPRLVAWAKDVDARYFPGREPVLARLEREYPEVDR